MTDKPLDLALYDDHLRVLRNHRDTGLTMFPAKVLAGAVQVAEDLRVEVGRLRDLIRDLADEDACWFDHHGGCQAHGYLSLKPGEKCPQQEARELFAKEGAP